MDTSVNIGILAILILLGVFQGFIISLFFIFKKTQNTEANRFQGLLLLTLALCINEQFLNMTGLITRVLHVTNTTEPLNLVIGPFLYLYVKRSLNNKKSWKEWIHFIIAILYFSYMFFDYVQPDTVKYNSYINSYHPDWPLLDVVQRVPDDPLKIKQYLNIFTAAQILFYIYLSLSILVHKAGSGIKSLVRTEDDKLRSLRNMVLHILVIVVIFIIVKTNFKADLGDYFIGLYVTVLTLTTTFRVMNDSAYFDRTASFMDISIGKYMKSSLNETRKQEILSRIIYEFENKKYFSENLASLSDLAKRTGESQHHVSQVINEKLGRNFFELLASYRVEAAKEILKEDKQGRITIEELSEKVGYNSKTAFNNAFKKLTGKTPSEFRKSSNS